MTRLVLEAGAKFWKESYLRIEREYCVHESGLMELPGGKVGGHLRVAVGGFGEEG
jgi:hypothetical protein